MKARTDIVVTTCDRVSLLKNTIVHILQRTASDSFNLTVIDDASKDGTQEYLRHMQFKSIFLKERVGIPAHLRSMLNLTTSDPIVFTDDDILCPKLDPDWLVRGLNAMETYPKLGILALNLPQCNIDNKRKLIQAGPEVSICHYVGGSFVFIRRRVLKKLHLLTGLFHQSRQCALGLHEENNGKWVT